MGQVLVVVHGAVCGGGGGAVLRDPQCIFAYSLIFR